MYWRVKKIGPKDVLRQYGVHAALAISLFFNFLAIIKLSSGHSLAKEQKTQFELFARQATNNLLDSSYLTFDDSMAGLQNQASSAALQQMRNTEFLPRTAEDIKAVSRQLRDKKMVSVIRIESVNLMQPDSQGLIPVEVKGQVVGHSAEGLEGPRSFCLRYLVGQRQGTQDLAIAGFQPMATTQQPQ